MKLSVSESSFLIWLLLLNLLSVPAWAQEPAPQLHIVIVEGEGAINNIKQRVNREPIVQVEDENRKPIAGAAVVFLLPGEGPSGTFANGTKTLTTVTDSQGRAVASGIRPNGQTGPLQIRVTASFSGQAATAVISQTNAVGAGGGAAGAGGGLSGTAKLLIILGIAGGAAVGGIVAATRGGGSSSSSSSGSTGGVVITAGTPTVGGPH